MRKNIGRLIVGCVLACCLSLSTVQSFAIESLKVSVQSTNAVLSWPSLTNETYIVQYRSNLNAAYSWLTLTDFYAATISSNVTFFVHSNSVTYPPPSNVGTNSGGSIDPNGTNTYSGTNNFYSTTGFYRVVRDGVHLWGITNGMVLHDELITPIEFSVGSTDQIVGISFYDENNSPIIGASAESLNSNEWFLIWNTTMSFNGNYTIYPQMNFASDNSVVGLPVSVTVNNTISFPNYFSQVFGDQLWIYAQTIPNAAYEIDIYDENTNYLGSFDDYADGSGLISFTWDLTDGNGNTFDSTNFLGVFTVTYSTSNVRPVTQTKGGSPVFQRSANQSLRFGGNHAYPDSSQTATAKQLWVKESKWTPNNNWVVAYAPLTDPVADPNTSYRESLMMLGGSDGNDGGIIGTLSGNDFHGNLSPGNVPQTSAFELGDTTTRGNLLTYLASSTYENFYYFGHGDNSHISAYNAPATAISIDQIAFTLGNVLLSYENPDLVYRDPTRPNMIPATVSSAIRRVANHPYRFVFLDGCETASGKFSEAFGIPAVTVSTNYFATAGVESRAFLGYQKSITFNTS